MKLIMAPEVGDLVKDIENKDDYEITETDTLVYIPNLSRWIFTPDVADLVIKQHDTYWIVVHF